MRRRDFLMLAGVAAAGAAGRARAAHGSDPESAAGPGGGEASPGALGVLMDSTICIRCRKCEWACDRQHHLSDHQQAAFEDRAVCRAPRRPTHDAFTVVNEYAPSQDPSRPCGVKVQCMHCLQPACASACLVGALRKDPRGPVTYTASRCIGCRYCMVACPFEIPAYEYERALEPRVRKCDFCHERVTEQGLPPACVEICPNEALTFGTREQLIDTAYIRMKATPERYHPHLYGEHEVGGTSWLYLLPVEPSLAGFPALDGRPVNVLTETIQHGVFKGFIPPLALYGLLGLAMLSSRNHAGPTDAPPEE
jgi:Fe-S-cluster-containing dehydrogenase component